MKTFIWKYYCSGVLQYMWEQHECAFLYKKMVQMQAREQSKQGALTNWKAKINGKVRTGSKWVSKGDSQTGKHRWVGKSGHGASKGDSQIERHRWVGKSGHGVEQVSKWARGTHKLVGTDGWATSGKHHLSFHTFSHLITDIRQDKTEPTYYMSYHIKHRIFLKKFCMKWAKIRQKMLS